MKKRILSLILVLSLIFILIVPTIAFGAVVSVEEEAALIQEDNFEEFEELSFVDYGNNSSLSGVDKTLYDGFMDYDEKIYLITYRVTFDDIKTIYSNVINDNPDLFFVSSSFKAYRTIGSQYVNYVVPQYSMTSTEVEEAQTIFNNGVEKVLSQIDPSMNDLQKALTIHEIICDMAQYPDISTEDKDLNIYHSAYGLFYDGNVVCAGYTLAYSYLMNKIGIESEYVVSSGMTHAWNKVKIDGNWYNIDLTYDDHNTIEFYNTRGSVSHNHFLKSDEYFMSESGSYHFDIATYDDCEANDTTYDSMLWDDICSRIYVLDNYYYFLKPNYTNGRTPLMKADSNFVTTTVNNSFRINNLLNFSSVVTDEEGNSHELSSYDVFARLFYLDNRFYVAIETTLYSYTLGVGVNTIATLDYYVIGLGSTNNELTYNYYGDEEEYSLNKNEYFLNYAGSKVGGNYNNYPDINNDGFVNGKDFGRILSNH